VGDTGAKHLIDPVQTQFSQ